MIDLVGQSSTPEVKPRELDAGDRRPETEKSVLPEASTTMIDLVGQSSCIYSRSKFWSGELSISFKNTLIAFR